MSKESRDYFRNLFRNINYLSATSDIWERDNRSFIAVSVHYIEPDTFEFKTVFIACERFEGRHTNDRVTEKLNKIFDRFGILGKVFFITTDGAGEYQAALKYYGDNYKSIQPLIRERDAEFDWVFSNPRPNDTHNQVSVETESDSESDSDLDIETIHDPSDLSLLPYNDREMQNNVTCMNNNQNRADSFVLKELFPDSDDIGTDLLQNMNQVNCSAHMLDKLGKKDASDAKTDGNYNLIHDKVFDVLQSIWNVKDSRLRTEVFIKITGKKVVPPHRIRWSKTYDAVSMKFVM